MIEQGKFLEMLQEIIKVAESQENSITKDELKRFMGGVDLSEEQLESVYAYLAENKIKVQGFTYVPPKAKVPASEKVSEEDSKYLKIYKEDLQEVEQISDEQKETYFKKMLAGDEEARQHLMNACIHDVLPIVKKYQNKGVTVEDLIQEGNMALMNALLSASEDVNGSAKEYLEQAMEHAIVIFIDEVNGNKSSEETIVAKANLIREAAKYLDENYGHAPTIDDLADYTKLPIDEVRDIVHLSKKS